MVCAFALMVLAIAAAAQGAPIPLAATCALVALSWPALRAPRMLPAFLVAGVVVSGWCAANGQRVAAGQLHPALSGTMVDARVRTEGAVIHDLDALRFTVVSSEPTLPARLRVSWPLPAAPDLGPGQCWRLRLRLRPIEARRNPGAFDRRAWQLRRGIGATARVIPARSNARCDGVATGVGTALRGRVRTGIAAAALRPDVHGVLRALTIGERAGLSPATRDLLARTGTAHLVAISGLHVGMVAGLGYLLGRRVPRPRGAPAGAAAVVFALVPAALYAALSGFALPARRALLMLALVAVLQALRRPVRALRVVALAVIAVVITSPAFVVDASFVFSFTAVTALALYRDAAKQARDPPRRLLTAVRVQWVLGATMLPATVAAFGFASGLSLPANLLAVPWFSVLVVPIALVASAISLCVDTGSGPAWRVAGALVGIALDALEWTASLERGVVPARLPDPGAAAAAALLLGWAALARGAPGRGVAACALGAVLFAAPERPPPGCLRAAVLDVGHGTAIVAHGHRSVVAYDTGPAWPGGRAAATASLLPYLHRGAIGRVDVAVLSHADIDHTGGASVLAGAHPVSRWLVGRGIEAPGAATACAAGQRWHAAGVTFEVAWPVRGALTGASDNDGSCAVSIVAGQARLLVTGDIEARAERELVALRAARANAVTVPHHGSATSSTPPFVAATAARLAVVSARVGGRWPLPDARVARRWRASGATLAVTSGGAIGIGLCKGRAVRLQDPDPWAESGRALW